ncbi:MAG TPA: CHAT domain-containing protein [Blastocatellia bacterium]|nr:CHAT domain-containing protein [Blastocatellia bacterium]
MKNKTPSMPLMAFFVTALLLFASDSFAFKQSGKAESDRQSSESARKAEELFQDVLRMPNIIDSEPKRLRLQESMRLWEQIGKPEKAAQAALQVGDRYKQVRKYHDALYCYTQALSVKSLPGSIRLNALNAIALIYAQLYQGDLALRYFTESLKQARAINDIPAQVFALIRLANLAYQQGDKAQALARIAKAQKLNEQSNADADPALLYLLGQIRQEEGSVEEAKGALEEALAIYGRQGNVEGQVRTLCSISTISLRSSQKQEALEQATQAVELANKHRRQMVSAEDKLNASELLWRSMASLARAERAVGQKDKAIKSYEFAIAQFERVSLGRYIATASGLIASREEAHGAYRELVDVLMEQGEIQKAFAYVEYAKARALLNLTRAQQAPPPSDSSKQVATLRERSRLKTQKLSKSPSSNLNPERRAQLQTDTSDVEGKLQEEQVQNEMSHSRERLAWANLVKAEQLQKQMAGDQVALVEFFLAENRSYVWMFTRGNVFVEILPARKEIEKAVRSYLGILASPHKSLRIENDLTKLREQAQALFSILFGSLAKHIEPDQQLIVVPDGLLHYLPFETLINNERLLIEDHEISYDPSASMLDLLQDSGNRVDSEDRMEILAIGDPVFEPGSKAIGGKGMRYVSNKVMRQGKVMRQRASARGFSLPPLPRTRDEVQFIASLFPADRRKLLTGMESTEEAVKHESLRRYRRLHFATHSLIDEKSPLRSAVALTPDNNAEEDGFLEVSEISKLDLDCDLVVVSACQTGRGQLLTGEGIVGLSWAFLGAGARSVVVSLWNVSDISTSQLMKNFYQNMNDGLSNAAALRKAKLQMLNSGKGARHPYYWSAFVIVGKS